MSESAEGAGFPRAGVLATDEAAMRRALGLARSVSEAISEQGLDVDVPVAALVLDPDGQVLAEAVNARERNADPTAHAEILALRDAGNALGQWRLHDCTLVVTLEPCTMCAGAAVLARVSRVVYAAADDKAGAAGGLWDVLRDPRLNHRPEVVAGVLGPQGAALLRDFFDSQRSSKRSG